MADYHTRFHLTLTCTPEQAERLFAAIEFTAEIDGAAPPDGGWILPKVIRGYLVAPASADLDRLPPKQRPLAGILACFDDPDDLALGIDVDFDPPSGRLTIRDTDRAPNIDTVACLIQKLLPELLPLGFQWSYTSNAQYDDAFGGGSVAIGLDRLRYSFTSASLDMDLYALGYADPAVAARENLAALRHLVNAAKGAFPPHDVGNPCATPLQTTVPAAENALGELGALIDHLRDDALSGQRSADLYREERDRLAGTQQELLATGLATDDGYPVPLLIDDLYDLRLASGLQRILVPPADIAIVHLASLDRITERDCKLATLLLGIEGWISHLAEHLASLSAESADRGLIEGSAAWIRRIGEAYAEMLDTTAPINGGTAALNVRAEPIGDHWGVTRNGRSWLRLFGTAQEAERFAARFNRLDVTTF